jgi:hypothetical protein
MRLDATVVSQPVDAPKHEVYEFARQPGNLPQWASGLATGIHREGEAWFTDSPMGRVKLEMAPRNDFGVLDHEVTLPDGTTVHNAFRVTPAGDGCVLSFVVLRLPGVADEAFDKDVAHVASDLRALQALMEKR